MITDRVPVKLGLHKITKDDPEYWAVARLCTDEEAELAMKFGGIRKPKTFAQLKKLSGLEDKKLQEMLDHMSWTGLIEWNYENPQHEKQYVLPMFVPGSGEFSNMNKDLIEQHPELGMFFEHMTRLPLEKITPMVPPGGAGIGMHVIPVEKAIEMNSEAVSIEKISHWLDKYDGKYAKSPCSCRRSRKTYDEGCGDVEDGWCIAVSGGPLPDDTMGDIIVETLEVSFDAICPKPGNGVTLLHTQETYENEYCTAVFEKAETTTMGLYLTVRVKPKDASFFPPHSGRPCCLRLPGRFSFRSGWSARSAPGYSDTARPLPSEIPCGSRCSS